jgi:hypothetical protein
MSNERQGRNASSACGHHTGQPGWLTNLDRPYLNINPTAGKVIPSALFTFSKYSAA